MVLESRGTFWSVAGASVAILASGSATAQEIDRATPLIEAPREYSATPISVGSALLYPGIDVRAEYDDNIYALPENEIDDVRLTIAPRLNMVLDNDRFSIKGRALMVARQYLQNETENSVAGLLNVDGSWRISQANTLTFAATAQRAVEARGEPESLRNPAVSPRKYNVFSSELGFRHQGGRMVIGVRGTALRNNALRSIDKERDFSQLAAQGRIGFLLSDTFQVFGEGFATQRDFDVATDLSGVNRDSQTFGARGGISIDPGGFVRGEAAIGFSHFDPEDPSLEQRTGISAAANLIYQPTERLAVTLDAFQGDVATVRTGAQSRTDTRVRAGIQKEIYHNLRAQIAGIYRRSRYHGSGNRERTTAGTAEIEYLMNRRVGIALQGLYSTRNSTIEFDDFERFMVGVEMRIQY